MVSVVSKLKTSSDRSGDVPSFTSSVLAKELEQTFQQGFERMAQQAKDSLVQDVMAVVEKNISGSE
jgi:hypothetical protein